ncbi:hypothetical protein E2562_020998 [Oryza meyeriana var. granulata]|uniref:Uncharacterized protein n=1 Tax=Oryza meyeriana var. granulata TaxID=110450 RepID=A0A6G1DYH4_9ORYZ|nr:hypothetical protein E2562_020998 [Oryza meyeriana var. granulata]
MATAAIAQPSRRSDQGEARRQQEDVKGGRVRIHSPCCIAASVGDEDSWKTGLRDVMARGRG